MGKLTTHVLNLNTGKPAAGVRIELQRLSTGSGTSPLEFKTDTDGRVSPPMLEGTALQSGRYALIFHIAEFFRAEGLTLPEPAFLDQVIIDFGVADAGENYHVPLLVTPWSYSTYRGS